MEKLNIENSTTKQYEKWFWKDFNKTCIECINNCKQSSKVKLLNCNNYKIGEIK